MIKFSDIPATWLQVLEDIQKVCPSAVLAGGALRDLWHDRPVKDIDIFIGVGGIDEAQAQFEKLGGEPPDEGWEVQLADIADAGIYPESMKEVILVEDYVGDNPTGIPVQLIFVNWNTQYITDRFDFGICRIMTDGGSLKVCHTFEEDSANKALNIRRCNNKWMLAASISRILRMKEKYKDWDFRLEGVKLKEVDEDN